jgi:DNA-directed RNA polymerase beta subunit
MTDEAAHPSDAAGEAKSLGATPEPETGSPLDINEFLAQMIVDHAREAGISNPELMQLVDPLHRPPRGRISRVGGAGDAEPEPEPKPKPPLPRGDPEDLQPRRAYPPIAGVRNGELTKRDMVTFVEAAVDQQGLVGHNIDGYNDLVENGINRIMTQLFDIDRMLKNERTQTEADRRRKTYQVHIQFHDVKVGRPQCTTYLTGQFTSLWPNRARLTGLPYSGPVTLGATVSVKAHYEDGRAEEKVAEIPPFQIGSFPIMVGSSRCHTHNSTREGLKEMGEDPTDPGGYFIAKQNEYVVDLLENIRYNAVHIHARMKPNEHVRAEFLSQPGGAFENSSQIRIRYMTNGQLTVEINSTKFEKVRLPFFLLFRLFGMTSDRAIAESIVFDLGDEGPVAARMLDVLERAFQLADATFAPLVPELNREKLIQMTAERIAKYLTNPTAYATNDNAIQYLNEDLLRSLDRVLLPHMGQTAESRQRKLRFMGLIMHKMFLVSFGILPPTDRDGYPNKRVHGAGVSLAKAYKTQVNNSVVIPIFRAIKRELKNNPWESVTDKTLIDTFRNALTTSDLNRAMEQAITAGNKTIVVRRRAATNRVSSQPLERKNCLNTFSALRTVVTQNAGNASKQTERADMMRRVHPTYTGFICVAQSADTGENVGMRKQLAMTASVCTAGEALPLKLRLWDDPAVTRLDDVTSVEMVRRGLSRVFVNGEWVGCCTTAHELAARYRALRREGRAVDPFTTIYWDPVTDEVEFWLDVGRLRRPVLIVDNNIAEYDAARRAAHLRRKAKARGGTPAPAPETPPFRGVVVEGDDGFPRGVFFAEASAEGPLGPRRGEYLELTKAWHDAFAGPGAATAATTAATTAAASAAASAMPATGDGFFEVSPDREALGVPLAERRERAHARLALYQTADGPERLVAAGLAARATAPEGLVEAAWPLAERHWKARGGRGRKAGAADNAAVEFVQNIRFTPEHARAIVEGRLTLDDLVTEGVAEYITPEEQGNCLIAESIDVLREHMHDVTAQYSHCDVEQAIFGLAAHVSPYGDHTQPARVTYETNQARQTGGWYVLNFPFRTDKNRFFQFYNETPLVRTFTHKLIPANGTNVIIAYASYGGDNQEDSAIVCQASADRGLFAGAFFRYELAELEKGEMFCNPDALTTKNLKPNASYEKLVDGFIRVGSVVRYGDALIGRVAKLSRGRAGADEQYQFTDRSIVYRLKEPAIVEAVLRPRGANDELFGLVKLRYERPLRTGDKMSSRSGNKSIVALMLQQSDMPFAESGMTPDMIINTHSFPSRMTIGQLIETSVAKVCARKGVIADGTAFLPVDHFAIAAEMRRAGFRYNGRERMYNGMTGEFFNAAIFVGPTYEQRLQKFVLDDEQSVAGSGPTDATTGQPLGGKHVQGGLRLGEMENWGLEAHGAMLNLFEKTSTDSDGRIMYVCRGCCALAVHNEYHNVYQCRTCGELADISAVDSCKTAILLHEELAAASSRVRLGLRPREFEELAPAHYDIRGEARHDDSRMLADFDIRAGR